MVEQVPTIAVQVADSSSFSGVCVLKSGCIICGSHAHARSRLGSVRRSSQHAAARADTGLARVIGSAGSLLGVPGCRVSCGSRPCLHGLGSAADRPGHHGRALTWAGLTTVERNRRRGLPHQSIVVTSVLTVLAGLTAWYLAPDWAIPVPEGDRRPPATRPAMKMCNWCCPPRGPWRLRAPVGAVCHVGLDLCVQPCGLHHHGDATPACHAAFAAAVIIGSGAGLAAAGSAASLGLWAFLADPGVQRWHCRARAGRPKARRRVWRFAPIIVRQCPALWGVELIC